MKNSHQLRQKYRSKPIGKPICKPIGKAIDHSKSFDKLSKVLENGIPGIVIVRDLLLIDMKFEILLKSNHFIKQHNF